MCILQCLGYCPKSYVRVLTQSDTLTIAREKAAKALKEKGETPEELLRSIKENETAVAEAQRVVDAWKAIVGEKARREEAAKAEAERIATEKAEAERKAAEERERAEKEEKTRVEAERKAEEERKTKEEERKERDENGQPFVVSSDGTTTFGEITEDTGLTAAPIKLSEGVADEKGNGYGLRHIEARHGDQIRKAGFSSVEEFIEQVAKNYDVIKEGSDRNGNKTYRLLLTDKHNNTLMIELSKDGSYWNVNTAGVFKKSYGKDKKEVYNRHTTVKQSAETAETSQADEHSGTQSTSRMNVPTTSADKGSEKPEKKQEKQSVFDKAKEIADKEEKKRKAEADKPKQKPLTEAERKDAEEVAGALGYRVEWVDTMEENGTIDADKKVIRIAKDAENPLVQVLGHEVAHGVKRMDGGKFKALQKAAMEVVGEKEWNERIEKKRKLNAYAEGKLAEEVTCDIVGEALNDKDALKRLAESLRGEKGILARLRDAVARMVEYFKNRGDKEGVRRMKAADKLLAEFESALKEGVAPEQVKPEGVDRSEREGKKDDKTLYGVHNISEDKLRKAMKLGGLANPSMAVVDKDKGTHEGFGAISLIAPSSLVDKQTGRTAGSWITDAYTQRYPFVERVMSDKGYKKFKSWVDGLDFAEKEKKEIMRQATDAMESDNDLAWELMYLREKGVDVKGYTSEVDYPWEKIVEEYPSVEDIIKAMDHNAELKETVTKLAKVEITVPIYKAVSADVRRRFKEETGENASPLNPIIRKRTHDIYNRDYAPKLLDENGMPKASDVRKVIGQMVEKYNATKKVDFNKSKSKASTYVHNNGLYADYLKWQEGKLEEFGTQGRIFRGYKNDGTRKYVPETLSNVSKVMKEKSQGQTNGSEYTSFGSFIAKLAPRVDSKAEMRGSKSRLDADEAKQEFYEKWESTYYDLAKELYSDVFSGEARLHDIVLQSDPKRYAKKEYGITLSPSFLKRLEALKKAIREDLKSAYFETKFERPVMLNEFAAAVVPKGIGDDVRKGLEDAGLVLYEYDPAKKGDRERAANEASASDGIRFNRSEKTELTAEERELRDNLVERMRKGGLDVVTDSEEMQRVIDTENERTRESRKRRSAVAEERLRVGNTIDEAMAAATHLTKEEARAMRREWERKFKEETKELYGRVLSGNFDDVTLRLIDEFIDKSTPNNPYGRPLSKRLPPRVGQKMRGGERTGSIDALFSRISESAVGKDGKALPRAERERAIEEKKKELLKKWAIATGNWHTDIADFTDQREPIGSGTDYDVYLGKDGKSVIKVSKGKPYGKRFRPDVDNVALFNTVFPGSRYTIEGYGEIDGKFVRFLKQPIVDFTSSTPLTEGERVAYMEKLGFKPINKENTAFSNGEIIASDLQKSNIVKDKQGNVRVIDADMKLHTKDVGGNYSYPDVETDTTGLAEREEVNTGSVREHRVYHGSGADFDAFDHSHMGEGEGAQAYGWGTYVTEVEGIGRTYAEQNATTHNDALRALQHDVDAISDQLDRHRDDLKYDEEQLKRANEWRAEAELDYELFKDEAEELKEKYGESSPEYRNHLFNDIYTDEMKRAQSSVKSTEESIQYRKEKIAELEKALKDKQVEIDELPKEFPRHLYTVEIPDDNGSNYLDWNGHPAESLLKGVGSFLESKGFERVQDSPVRYEKGESTVVLNPKATGADLYAELREALGSDKKASQALAESGCIGIKYPADNMRGGRKDGAKNYVIFNENDAKITDHVRFLRTADGEVYGLVKDGRIYLDPKVATSETAVHEYTHLWGDMLRRKDSEQWSHTVKELKNSVLWEEVKVLYPELKTDDEIADEVLSTFSGRRGAERLREEARRVADGDGGVFTKAKAIETLERVKEAIARFWEGVARMFGINRYRSAEELADMAMRDLLDSKNPMKDESGMRKRGEVGDEGVKSLKGEEAMVALDNIFEDKKTENMPQKVSSLVKFMELFRKPVRTFLGEVVNVKEEVYNKIIREKRTSISGAVLPTLENADFAIRDTDGSTLYIKRFKSENNDNVYNIAVVNKYGEVEDYVSSVHIKSDNNLRNKITKGAELLLPQERITDGILPRNNPTPTANVTNISEPSKPRFSRKPGESIFAYASRVSEDVDRSVRERVSARDEYEKKVKSKGFQTKEALQNSMLGLQEFMYAIDHASGNKRYIEDIPDFENPILGENRLSSVNKEEMHQVAKTQFKPLMSAVAKLSGNGKESGELYDYMFAKHGLERDAVMRQREAQKEFDKYQKANPKGTKTIGDFVASLEGKDYAGLTALTAEDGRVKSIQSQIDAIDEQMKATDDQLLLRKLGGQKKRLKVDLLNAARDAADDIRKTFENNPSHDRSDINELWSRVNEVNGNTLRKLYESGLLTKEAYNDISSMYTNYIPMRGFDQTTSADAYAYLTHGDSAFNAPIKTAKGRSSKADNPIAYMQAMAESAIMQSNRNVLVKQKMLNFVRNHPSDLASVSDVWLQYDSVADEWKPVFPDNIGANDSASVVAKKMEAFEDKMKQMAEKHPNLVQRSNEAPDIPYKVVEKGQLNEHQVLVKQNGKSYIITVNGSPRAAQAANGLTNPDTDLTGAVGKVFEGAEALNRQLSSLYTTLNPDFIGSNYVRDALYSNTMVYVKEGAKYGGSFNLNFAKYNPAEMANLYARYNKGSLDTSNETHRLFLEFMQNGGETGFVNLKQIEKRKSEIAKAIKRDGRISAAQIWGGLSDAVDFANRAVENSARFAAYVTSRKSGRSVGRSVYDAKDISVNFNRKGSGRNWWKDNVGTSRFYDTEIGLVEINRASVVSSLAHRYSQVKLDVITSLAEGFNNAVYFGSMQDLSRQEGVKSHYFAYPINYNGNRNYVFCRAMQDANKSRLYVHEVFLADNIEKGNTLQTAASQPHGGITLYKDILANVLAANVTNDSETSKPCFSRKPGESIFDYASRVSEDVDRSVCEGR